MPSKNSLVIFSFQAFSRTLYILSPSTFMAYTLSFSHYYSLQEPLTAALPYPTSPSHGSYNYTPETQSPMKKHKQRPKKQIYQSLKCNPLTGTHNDCGCLSQKHTVQGTVAAAMVYLVCGACVGWPKIILLTNL